MKERNWWTVAFAAGLILVGGLAASPVPAAAQTLVVARGADGNSFDPAEAMSFEAIKMADWGFDALVRYNGDTLELIPSLATSWTRSEDGLTWTFKLRKGVKFHDGTDFNADAVVFSFERQRDHSNKYYNKNFARWPAKLGNVAKTEKVDDYTVKIQLKAPDPAFLVNLAIYPADIVSPTAVKKDPQGFRNHPVGTGPFIFVRSQRDNFTEYKANKDYWDGAPKIDRLIVRTIPDNNVRLLALKNNEIQVAYGISFSQMAQVKSDPNLKLLSSTSLGISMISLNTQKKPLDDLRVRKAINHAVDRNRIFDTVFSGYGEKADQVLPKQWFGHTNGGMRYDYDVAKAKKLLAEAGYPNGFKAQLIAWTTPRPYMPSPRDVAALLKSDLAKVGIDVSIQTMSWNVYRTVRGKGEYDMALGGWIAGTLDPDGIIYPLYDSAFIRKTDALNWSRWKNDEADKLMGEARRTYDKAKRTEYYQKTSEIIMDNSVSVFLAHPINTLVARKEVKGIFIHTSNWVPLKDVTIEK